MARNSKYPKSRLFQSHKIEIYGRRKMLSGKVNANRALYLTEKLPVYDLEKKQESDDQGLNTTIKNCQVEVSITDVEGNIHSQEVLSFIAVTQLTETALKGKGKKAKVKNTENKLGK